MTLSTEQEIDTCERCNKGCKFLDSAPHHCITHDITFDPEIGAHYCLSHNKFHCYMHYRYCRKEYGSSVMTKHPTNIYQLKKRANQIIQEQQQEIDKLERWLDQIKSGRFVCAECRSVLCMCDPSNWEYF